jgi:glutathione S-transferase
VVAHALNEEIPQILDYLEAVARDSSVPKTGFLFGPLSIADIAIAVSFRNAAFAKFRIDADRWPTAAGHIDRVLALPCFAKLIRIEDAVRRAPIAQHRDAIAQLGVAVTARSYATSTPRRGVMRTE